MKIQKIVIVRYAPYAENMRSLCGIDYLLANGIKIDYLDVTEITTGERNELVGPGKPDGFTEIRIKSYKEFENYVKSQQIDSVIFFTLMGYFRLTARCFRILSKYNCHIAYIVFGCFPEIQNTMIEKLRHLRAAKLRNKLLNQIAVMIYKSSLIKAADLMFLTCGLASRTEYKTNKNTQFVLINSAEYETSKDITGAERSISDKYILFIDQYFPFHEDIKIQGNKYIDSDVYYSKINSFFEVLENTYKAKIVIAAHPTAIKYKAHNYFNGRKVAFGETGALVKDCMFVIAHYSTAVCYPVMFKKKIIFVTMDEIKNTNHIAYQSIKLFSKMISSEYINLDDKIELSRNMDINEKKYEEYKYNYLTNKESENKSNGQIILEAINTL